MQPVALNGVNDGYLEFTDALGYAEVIITVANVHPSLIASYTYAVGTLWDPVFEDDFESGDTSVWANVVP